MEIPTEHCPCCTCTRKEGTWEPALEEASQIGRPGRDRKRTLYPREVAILLSPGRSCTQRATPASGRGRGKRAPPDVIVARRRLRFCHFAGEVVGANGSRALITDSPSRGPAHLFLFGLGAAMVSRPGGRAAPEALQAGCGRGLRRVAGWGGRRRVLRGARLGCGAHRGRSVQGMWLLRGTFTLHPDSWGKGGRKRNADLDPVLKVTFVFSTVPNLSWNVS